MLGFLFEFVSLYHIKVDKNHITKIRAECYASIVNPLWAAKNIRAGRIRPAGRRLPTLVVQYSHAGLRNRLNFRTLLREWVYVVVIL